MVYNGKTYYILGNLHVSNVWSFKCLLCFSPERCLQWIINRSPHRINIFSVAESTSANHWETRHPSPFVFSKSPNEIMMLGEEHIIGTIQWGDGIVMETQPMDSIIIRYWIDIHSKLGMILLTNHVWPRNIHLWPLAHRLEVCRACRVQPFSSGLVVGLLLEP